MRYFWAAGILAIAAIFSAGQIIQFYEGAAASQSGHTFVVIGTTVSIAGILAACVVLWEAVFYPIARVHYNEGNWVTGTLALLALVIAIGYTFSGDFESIVTGRADKVAERSAATDNRGALKSEIASLSSQRNGWETIIQKQKESISNSRLRELNQRIDQANERIASLQKRMEAAPVNAGGAPASEFLHEHLGQTIGWWASVLLFFKLAFPALMRALAWEFALKALGLLNSKKRDKPFTKTITINPVPAFTPIAPQKWEALKALSAPVSVTPLVPYATEVGHKDPAAPVTPAANDNPAPVTPEAEEATHKESLEVAAVTPSALEAPELPLPLPEPEDVVAVTDDASAGEAKESAPVTAPAKKKSQRQKNLEKFTAYAPQTCLPIEGSTLVWEEYARLAREAAAGRPANHSTTKTRINRVEEANGLKLSGMGKISKQLKIVARELGIVIKIPTNRQYQASYVVEEGKKERQRLGNNPLESLTA